MNYRHAFHAGNHADVFKHAVLVRLLEYLRRKEKPFRVIDTHAGRGLYDLGDDAATRAGEWRDGIGRLAETTLGADAEALLAPYRAAVASCGHPARYPGSPLIARQMLRPQDRLTAIELHPDDHLALADQFGGDHQARVSRLDGWLALKGHLPPKERRGLVLVDPPFEASGEFERMAEHLRLALQRFGYGVFALWYPIKAGAPVAEFHRSIKVLGAAKVMVAELSIGAPARASGLSGSGMVIVNPPYTMGDELSVLLPALAHALGRDGTAAGRWFWLADG